MQVAHRVPRTRRARPLPPAFEPPAVLGAFTRMNLEPEASGTAWFLYTYLAAVGAIKGTNPFTTNITELLNGFEFEGQQVSGVRMALNSVKSNLELLEDMGFIEVRREKRAQTVHLTIRLEG